MVRGADNLIRQLMNYFFALLGWMFYSLVIFFETKWCPNLYQYSLSGKKQNVLNRSCRFNLLQNLFSFGRISGECGWNIPNFLLIKTCFYIFRTHCALFMEWIWFCCLSTVFIAFHTVHLFYYGYFLLIVIL